MILHLMLAVPPAFHHVAGMEFVITVKPAMMEIPAIMTPALIPVSLHNAVMDLSKERNNATTESTIVIQQLMPAEPIAPTSVAGMEFVTPVKPVTMEILITPMLAKTTVPPQPAEMALYKRVSNNAMTVP